MNLNIPHTMTPTQMAALLDAAMRLPAPLTYFDGAVSLFKVLGRHEDATATAWMGCLFAEDEIEILLTLRTAWRRGEAKSPAEAMRIAARSGIGLSASH
jgi:hypothetical protein